MIGATADQALLTGADTAPPEDWPRTLPAALERAARTVSRGITYVDDEGRERFQNYRHLLRAAGLSARRIAERVAPGTPVLIAAGDARVQLTAFWGCVIAGAVPVPVGATGALGDAAAGVERIRAAHELLGGPLVLVDEVVSAVAVAYQVLVDRDGDVWNADGRSWHGAPELPAAPRVPQDVAIGLLTSGSTGKPKCVLLTHAALAHRAWAAAEFNDLRAADVALNWMPLDHVGGIVMWVVQAAFLGCSLVQVDTARVLGDPLTWLDLLEAHRASTTWAPNFGFALVCSALRRHPDRRWDLHRLRHVLDGGEAVVAAVADEFLGRLAPYGLSAAAFCPAWGMSETGSGVVYSRLSRGAEKIAAVRVRMDGPDQRVWHDPDVAGSDVRPESVAPRVRSADAKSQDGWLELAVTGVPVPGVRIRVVGPDGSVLPEDRIGTVQVGGATLFAGYYGREPVDGWFTTGDQGFVTGGALVVTGRNDDVVVINGVNIPCQEVEAVVERVDGVLAGYAAFGVIEVPDGVPCRVVFVCVRTGFEVASRIRESVARRFGFSVDEVRVLPVAEFPRTSSGKVQRARLRADHRVRPVAVSARPTALADSRRDPLAATVSEVWAGLLGLTAAPRPTTSFFASGGTSMSAVRCVALLGAELDRRVPVGLLYEHPTFAEFVAALGNAARPPRYLIGTTADRSLVEQGDRHE